MQLRYLSGFRAVLLNSSSETCDAGDICAWNDALCCDAVVCCCCLHAEVSEKLLRYSCGLLLAACKVHQKLLRYNCVSLIVCNCRVAMLLIAGSCINCFQWNHQFVAMFACTLLSDQPGKQTGQINCDARIRRPECPENLDKLDILIAMIELGNLDKAFKMHELCVQGRQR